MEEGTCLERRKTITDKLEAHGERLHEHDNKIDNLEKLCAEDRVNILNLCKSLDNLTVTIKWVGGTFLGGMVGFFFYILQNSL